LLKIDVEKSEADVLAGIALMTGRKFNRSSLKPTTWTGNSGD